MYDGVPISDRTSFWLVRLFGTEQSMRVGMVAGSVNSSIVDMWVRV